MASAPDIETERCWLRPFSEVYLTERYVSWLGDPDVVRHSDQRHRRHTMDSCRAYMQSFETGPHFFMAIVAKDPALGHVGNINAYVDVHNAVADIGILVGERSVWGRGYGSEAWGAFAKFLLKDRNLRKVTAGTMSVNHGMLGIMRRTGMNIEATRRRQALWEGQEVDMVYAALFREEV